MARRGRAQDRRFPVIALDNPVRRLLERPDKYCAYTGTGETVTDLGSGPGFHTLALADCVDPSGTVHAVNFAVSVRALERKAARRGVSNIVAHVSSAADLAFIADGSVDLVVADGLLCCMAPEHQAAAVAEIKRILTPGGQACIAAGRGRGPYVTAERWAEILGEFAVEAADPAHWWSDHRAAVCRRGRGQGDSGRGGAG